MQITDGVDNHYRHLFCSYESDRRPIWNSYA
jgi:hypothetical protein